jgi:hypothetical protein
VMNPLQQQLAVQLIDKLRHNMDGWYPAISRVLLATIGPYASSSRVSCMVESCLSRAHSRFSCRVVAGRRLRVPSAV